MDNYTASLEKNAIDSLEESIIFLERSQCQISKIRIAIILLDNSIELIFKTYIAKKHPLLIFLKPSDEKSNTLTLQQALILLERLDYKLTDSFKQKLKSLREMRNVLNHSFVCYPPEKWKEEVGAVLYYLLKFDETHDNLFNIQSRASPEKWKEIIDLKEIFELHLKNATNNASENTSHEGDPLDFVDCPECGNSYVSATEDYRVAHCYFCKNDFEIEQCSRCGTWFSSDSLSGDICDNCWEYIRSD